MKNKIKEKVLKGMFSEDFLKGRWSPETQITMDGIEAAIALTLAKVREEIEEKIKHIDKYSEKEQREIMIALSSYRLRLEELLNKLGEKEDE